MTATLPQSIVSQLKQRIADPARRHFRSDVTPVGAISDPDQLQRMFEQEQSAGATAFAAIRAQMAAWGQAMPTMHVSLNADGLISASTDDPAAQPIAPPATIADLAELERILGSELPEDLRQMWAIADGGWGPGFSHTPGHGPGLLSVKGSIADRADLQRRGAGYTGEIAWPDNLLPLSDGGRGMVSYDLASGSIVAFDEYWSDDGLSAEQAFSAIHSSLGAWLLEWLEE